MQPMSNRWQATIDISKEWKLAQEDPDNTKKLCEAIVLKLNNIPMKLKDDYLEDIIEQFNLFDPDIQDVDDFDLIITQLYNWADGNKRLWVDTFGRKD